MIIHGDNVMIDLYHIPCFDGYLITKQGVVWTTKQNQFRPLKAWTHKQGYLMLNLCNNNKRTTRPVHRFMAYTFLYDDNTRHLDVNHIDGNKLNNKLENLELVTQSQNISHAYQLGLIPSRRGEGNTNVKLTEKFVLEIREMLKSKLVTQRQIAKSYNAPITTIENISVGRTWRHLL